MLISEPRRVTPQPHPFPELVVRDGAGRVESVAYELTPMMLNECNVSRASLQLLQELLTELEDFWRSIQSRSKSIRTTS